ncbi:hypothetical protein HPB48_012360 [Haemaphysalis longicornis]|uniref:R3H domain-containing protein n=1 Tax=Haemaphysalis longicornis TaxID=44386 RepID=A0A9J6G4C9_HAELO|nr:hypothetical protein HPB48_012360 [Haemaphysalis longicornis]
MRIGARAEHGHEVRMGVLSALPCLEKERGLEQANSRSPGNRNHISFCGQGDARSCPPWLLVTEAAWILTAGNLWPSLKQPVRLSKQREVLAEAAAAAAEEQAPQQVPVTIRLELGTEEEAPEAPSRSSAQRLKVLVRSHALRDDASPPLDLSPEAAAASPQMLSVQGPASCKALPGSKPARLSKQGTSSSQGSLEGSSPSLSRDSSTETYTDSTGVDLEQFIVDTLHKNHKDRVMMLKIEQDLLSLVKDNKRQSFKFAQMSSYHRMLVHRVAAYFGLDHNVDQAGTAVIVSKTRNTRLPDVRFKDQIRDDLLSEEPKKLILKRDSASFEDGKEASPFP